MIICELEKALYRVRQSVSKMEMEACAYRESGTLGPHSLYVALGMASTTARLLERDISLAKEAERKKHREW